MNCTSGADCVAPTLVEGEKGGGTQGFLGFQISFDTKQGLAPKFVAGLRHTEVSDSGRIIGADLSLRVRLQGGPQYDSVVLSLLGGDADFLGGAGVGYSYYDKGWLFSGTVEKESLRLGVDYGPNAETLAFFAEAIAKSEADSSPDRVTCPDNFMAREDAVVSENTKPADGQFFVFDADLLVGSTTCEPDNFSSPR